MTYILKITLQTLHGMCKILKGEQELYMCVSMCTFVCVCARTFFPNRLPSISLHSQHLLPSAVHHSDSRDSGRGSGWKRSSRLPYVMDRNSLESPNGSNLTLTSSSHGLHDPSTNNLWPLMPDSATHKQKWVKILMKQLHLSTCSF